MRRLIAVTAAFLFWVFGLAALGCLVAAEEATSPRFDFTRLIAHWAEYADEGYLSFVEAARPDVVQVGFYGAHFWGLAHTPHGKGYPAHFPVQGLRECGDWFRNLNQQLHARNVKVVGHMNVKFLVGDLDGPDGPRGFFHFYHNLWDENVLGPKPVRDAREYLEIHRDGTPISNSQYSIGGMKEYWACLNNPHWRMVLKAWTKYAIQQGVDGLIANYFYRHDCHCPHCVRGFKEYLAKRYSAEQLRAQFGIADLSSHTFSEIVAWHDPAASTPLRREMLRFSQLANKQAFDEVFVAYGRSLKKDLLVAQWNHLGNFAQINGDERCLLPGDVWGRDEDYLWYSTGGAAFYTDLSQGILGEGTLQARYIRGAFDDKPFTLGKYENTRIRVAIAELAANGGAPMGFYTRFTDPAARDVIVQYYQFLRRHEALYKGNRPWHDAVLLYPRSKVHQGDTAAVERFLETGKRLLDEHVLFDVLPDDLADADRRQRYRAVVEGGADAAVDALPADRSRFQAPPTVRVSASQPAAGGGISVHLVNYNRTEPSEKRSPGRGIKDERPIGVSSVSADLRLPKGSDVRRVEFLTPEAAEAQVLPFEVSEGRLRFKTPPFLVYGVVHIRLVRSADTQ